jgi:nitrogen permease regulator 2-like protein
VLCQVPAGSIVPPSDSFDSSALAEPLIKFDYVKNYVIPKAPLCNKLVTFLAGDYRIEGHPVLIYGDEYERNSFIFNFSFVFHADSESNVYETSIRRLARLFQALEEQSHFLSKATNISTISNIIEQMYQDLNNYSECMIPVDESTSINMKLFPLYSPPPEIESFHVPISTVRLEALKDDNWDPTMEKIVKYINGINSVRRIADLSDSDYTLTKQCIQHLYHYNCLVIVDLFQFSNIYAPTSNISTFVTEPQMVRECQSYVYLSNNAGNGGNEARGRMGSQVSSGTPQSVPDSQVSVSASALSTSSSSISYYPTDSHDIPSDIALFRLYLSLHQGQTVHDWCLENADQLRNIDVRRFLSFGVIKGLIYRVHNYPILDYGPGYLHQQHQAQFQRRDRRKSSESRLLRPIMAKNRMDVGGLGISTSEEIDDLLTEILKQPKHFDAICTDLRLPRKDVEKMLQRVGDWTVING